MKSNKVLHFIVQFTIFFWILNGAVSLSTFPVISPVSVSRNNRISTSYALSAVNKYSLIFVALFTKKTNNPVANGSNVPAWLILLICNFCLIS